MDNGWRTVECNPYIEWDDPKTVEGYLTAYGTERDDWGNPIGELDDFRKFFVTTRLREILRLVPVGSYIRITYTGDVPTSNGHKMKQFDVRIRERKKKKK